MLQLQTLVDFLETQSQTCEVVEIACELDAPVSEVRHQLKALGDRVFRDHKGSWGVTSLFLAPETEKVSYLAAPLLTPEERAQRDALEQKVEQSLAVFAHSLKVLKEKRLFRETHSSFAKYVADRFKFKVRRAYQIIAAGEIATELQKAGVAELPVTEAQYRQLAKVAPPKRPLVWEQCLQDEQEEPTPSKRTIQNAIANYLGTDEDRPSKTIKPSNKAQIQYQPGVGISYTIALDEELYGILKQYQQRVGAATPDGAIARLLRETTIK